jgi:glutamate--cysteine ligase
MLPNLSMSASASSNLLQTGVFELEKKLINLTADIERWFRLQWKTHQPPVYGSVDLRNAGYKLAPVDTNLFPGGFNNLATDVLPLAVQAAMSLAEHACPDAKNLLLIPENHTRNQFYLTNVIRLAAILRQAGFVVRLGSLNPDIQQATQIVLDSGESMLLEPLIREEVNGSARVMLKDFDPCFILLNNDLSAGTPDILRNLNGQMLMPPLHAGWTLRKKSVHFAAFDQVARDFGAAFDFDPWLFSPYFGHCGQVDFQTRSGTDCLESQVAIVLDQIKRKYREYQIDDEPFVIVKADAGTYGMGIMTVKSPEDVRDLNRKTRNKMAVIKDGLAVSDVIIQEGVRSLERVDQAVAEPVVYMMDRYVVGGFYRSHAERGQDENLNAPGMRFDPVTLSSTLEKSTNECLAHFNRSCHEPTCLMGACEPNRFYAYGVVARMALLAASIELEQTQSLLNPQS